MASTAGRTVGDGRDVRRVLSQTDVAHLRAALRGPGTSGEERGRTTHAWGTAWPVPPLPPEGRAGPGTPWGHFLAGGSRVDSPSTLTVSLRRSTSCRALPVQHTSGSRARPGLLPNQTGRSLAVLEPGPA